MSDHVTVAAPTNPIPSHIPLEQVKAFDFFADPRMSQCPFAATASLHGKDRVFWNPTNWQFGGAWVLTTAEDIRFVLSSPDLFTNKGEAGFSGFVGESWDLIPLELDPPDHTKFRKLLNPLLAPPVVAKMTPGIKARAAALVDTLRGQGGCEFMAAFGRPFPVGIFMQLMGLPAEQTDTFLKWEYDLLHEPDMRVKVGAAVTIRDYLRDLAADRRANPKDDIASFVVTSVIDGHLLTDDQVMGILYLLFVGGLDTVASSLGFFFRHLAEHPEQQDQLRQHPELIEKAVEELLRRYSVVTSSRQCKVDVEVGGARMKQGDWITINDSLASLDPAEFSRPLDVDFERKNVRHLGFSFGPHFCMGSHLARRELAVALQEWLARMPAWRLKDNAPIAVHGGGVFGVEHLELEWDVV